MSESFARRYGEADSFAIIVDRCDDAELACHVCFVIDGARYGDPSVCLYRSWCESYARHFLEMAPWRFRPELSRLDADVVLGELFDVFFETDACDLSDLHLGTNARGEIVDLRDAFFFCEGLCELLIDDYDGVVFLTDEEKYRFLLRRAADGSISDVCEPRDYVDEVMRAFRDGMTLSPRTS